MDRLVVQLIIVLVVCARVYDVFNNDSYAKLIAPIFFLLVLYWTLQKTHKYLKSGIDLLAFWLTIPLGLILLFGLFFASSPLPAWMLGINIVTILLGIVVFFISRRMAPVSQNMEV